MPTTPRNAGPEPVCRLHFAQRMATLFEFGLPAIPGLALLREYIREADELRLARLIDAEPWDETWDRRRQLYGGAYGKAKAAPREIPPWGRQLIERMAGDHISDRPFDQMLVNEYLPGQGIALHRDYEPYDRTVVSLSLLAPCVMDFRRVADAQRESLLLDRRSLLVLSDVARYEWEHGIARRQRDRWHGLTIARSRRLSITFRNTKLPDPTKPR